MIATDIFGGLGSRGRLFVGYFLDCDGRRRRAVVGLGIRIGGGVSFRFCFCGIFFVGDCHGVDCVLDGLLGWLVCEGAQIDRTEPVGLFGPDEPVAYQFQQGEEEAGRDEATAPSLEYLFECHRAFGLEAMEDLNLVKVYRRVVFDMVETVQAARRLHHFIERLEKRPDADLLQIKLGLGILLQAFDNRVGT